MTEKSKINLVLFKEAIEHITRITRVLTLRRGNFLYIGMAGSGKKCLTTLACLLSNSK